MVSRIQRLLPIVLLGFVACKGESQTVGSPDGSVPSDASLDADASLPTCTSNPEHGQNVLFELSIAHDAGAPAPGAGGAGSGASGCTQVMLTSTCTGTARATSLDNELAFVFGDGSTLTWIGSEQNVPPPAVATGDDVWIDYEEVLLPRCGFCGTYIAHAISILESEGGEPLLVATDEQEADPSESALDALFGATARIETACRTNPYPFDCWELTSDVFDHVLETTPEQRIPYGALTLVETPRGTFYVTWSTADHTQTPLNGCADGRTPRAIRDFAAARVVF